MIHFHYILPIGNNCGFFRVTLLFFYIPFTCYIYNLYPAKVSKKSKTNFKFYNTEKNKSFMEWPFSFQWKYFLEEIL